jgi:hypothetical protein
MIGPAGGVDRGSATTIRTLESFYDPNDDKLGYEKKSVIEDFELEEGDCGCGCEESQPEELEIIIAPEDDEMLYEKKDRCYYLAKQKYDVFPSAYASGAIVKCRKGKIWKKKSNEEVELDEEWSDKYKRSIECDNPKGFSQRAHCQGRKDEELGLEEIELDEASDYEYVENLEEGTFDKEKSQGLHGWFARKGGKGKSKGWVDCNTCRTNPKTGRKTCKSCGRQSGEQRSKYPACRPTPSACNRRGTSKKRGPTRVSWKKKKKEE